MVDKQFAIAPFGWAALISPAFLVMAGAYLLLVGCAKPPRDPELAAAGTAMESAPAPIPLPEGAFDGAAIPTPIPQGIGGEVVSEFQRMPHYAEQATITVTYFTVDGSQESVVTRLNLRYAAPNHIWLELASEENRVQVACDGSELSARINDPMTRDFDRQQVSRPAPAKLTLGDLYSVTELMDPLAPGEMLSALLGSPVGLDQTSLGLLLGEGSLVQLLGDATTTAGATATVSLDHVEYQILESRREEGTYRFWIGQQPLHVRRIEFPANTQQLPPGITRVELVVDMQNVSYGVIEPSQFQLEANWGQHAVRHFVLPPLAPPTELLGNRFDGLRLSDEAGRAAMLTDRQQQIAVGVWFDDHPASRFVLEQIEQVRLAIPPGQCRIALICVDAESDPNTLLKRWNLSSSAWRDPHQVGRGELGITEAPSTAVLGPQGTLHYLEVGANPNIAAEVQSVLSRLAAGEDVASATKERVADAKQMYQRQLALAQSQDGWIEQPTVELPAASKPQQLGLQVVWKNEEVPEPGNMLVYPGKSKRLLLLDSWNSMVAIDLASGKLQRRIQLDLPPDEGVTFLRAGKGAEDRPLIAAAASGGRRGFVFDTQGRRQLAYPPEVDGSLAIGDLLLADLNQDAKAELIVGWQGSRGIECIDLQGQRLWSNRALGSVVSLGVTDDHSSAHRGQLLVAAGPAGEVVLIDRDGRTLSQLPLELAGIHQVAVWPGSARGFSVILSTDGRPDGRDESLYCGFSLAATGEPVAIGIDRHWNPVWRYPLPQGTLRHQLDQPQTISLPGANRAWLLAGADGSVHIVSVNGNLRDSFRLGKHLRGMAATNSDEQLMLVICSDGDVTAYAVTAASD